MKLFKFLFKVIIFILIIITIVIILLSKSVKAPIINNDISSFNTILNEEVDDLISDDITNKNLSLTLSVDEINKTIKDNLLATSNTSDETYVSKSGRILLQGSWVEYNEDTIDLIIGLHIDLSLFKLKTRVLISFEVVQNNDEIVLTISKFKLGNLGLKWLVKLVPGLINNLTGVNINDSLKQSLGTSGVKYDAKKLAATININELISDNLEDDKASHFIKLLTTNNLVKVGFNDEQDRFGVILDLNPVEDRLNKLNYSLDMFDSKIEVDLFLQNKALSSVLLTPGKINFSEEEINNLLKFNLTASNDLDYLSKSQVFLDLDFIIGIPYIKLDNNQATLNLPILIGRENNYFKTKIVTNISFNKTDKDLIININNLSVSNLIIEDKLKTELIKIITTSNDSKIVFKDFFDHVDVPGFIIEDTIDVNNNNVVIKYN